MRPADIFGASTWSLRWFQTQHPLVTNSNLGKEPFQWHTITPSPHFQWHECFGNYQCARLQVPMDWQGTSSEVNKTVEIAVIRLEATVAITDKRYGGPVVLNPGGPGESGVAEVLKGGHSFRTLLSAGPDDDEESSKHFEIIGFDPRGVNNSTPFLTCFPDHLAAAAYHIELQTNGWIETSSTSFDNIWAMKRGYAEGCSKRMAQEGIAKHVSTAPVARDIIEIVEQHGRWREQEAQRLLSSSKTAPKLSAAEKATISKRVAYQAGREMVQYWGLSYGTVLGGTLAAMYPDRMKRIVLDGVVDMFDYMAGEWSTNLRDTDKQLPLMAEYCYNGGPQNCAIYDARGPSAIVENILNITAALKANPISCPGLNNQPPTIITSSDLQYLTWRRTVYHPLALFPQTAQIFSELASGNGTALALLKTQEQSIPNLALSPECLSSGPFSFPCAEPILSFFTSIDDGASSAIYCSDGPTHLLNHTKSSYRAHADKILSQSTLLGGWWATIPMACTSWTARAHWRYEGNFTAKTAHPLLFVANTVDPVTPRYNALKMAEGYEGAAVLQQTGEGHCSYTAPSMCAGKALRRYFQTGDLPGGRGGRESCGMQLVPFQGYSKDSEVPGLPEGERDAEMWEALIALNRAWA